MRTSGAQKPRRSVKSGAEPPPLRVDLTLNKGGGFDGSGPESSKFSPAALYIPLQNPLQRALKCQNFRLRRSKILYKSPTESTKNTKIFAACGGLTAPQAIFSLVVSKRYKGDFPLQNARRRRTFSWFPSATKGRFFVVSEHYKEDFSLQNACRRFLEPALFMKAVNMRNVFLSVPPGPLGPPHPTRNSAPNRF